MQSDYDQKLAKKMISSIKTCAAAYLNYASQLEDENLKRLFSQLAEEEEKSIQQLNSLFNQ